MGTDIDYSTVSHETIYQHITGGLGGTGMMDASQGWRSVAAQLQEIQILVDQAVRGIGIAQQGAAADAATQATTALLPWVTETAAMAAGIADRVDEQATIFAHTRGSMPPPREVPEVSFSQDPGTWMADHAADWLPGIQTEHERAQVAAQQDEQRARELMNGYQSTSNELLTVGQQFTAAPVVVADLAPPVPGERPNAGWRTRSSPAYAAGAYQDGAHLTAVDAAGAYPADLHPADSYSAAVAGEHAGALTGAVSSAQLGSGVPYAPAAVAPQLAGGYPSPGAQPIAGSGSAWLGGATPIGPSPMLTGSATTSSDRLRGGSHRRADGFGPRPSAAFSTGEAPLSSSPGQHGPVGHNAPPHSDSIQGGVKSASAGRSDRAGFADAPFAATGGSGGGGDTVHRRPSYLLEQDTNAIVGELPRVAPPVIGAEEDYR
ncbi:MAG: PPE domain-containing protein [Pseudonocardiaceae bacterium]